jgi:hypothetical protein
MKGKVIAGGVVLTLTGLAAAFGIDIGMDEEQYIRLHGLDGLAVDVPKALAIGVPLHETVDGSQMVTAYEFINVMETPDEILAMLGLTSQGAEGEGEGEGELEPLALLDPNGGETWVPGVVYTITWTGPGPVELWLHKAAPARVRNIGRGLIEGFKEFLVPPLPDGDDYTIEVVAGETSDFSDGPFRIAAGG